MTDAPETITTGEQERHLALSTLVQQGNYVWTTLVMLVVVTALARTLTLSEFGVYGLVVSFAAYLLVAQGAIESAAVRSLAQAQTGEERDRVFSMAFFLYVAVGLVIGVIIAVVGNLLVSVFKIPDDLHRQARIGFLCLGLITWVGWPMKTFTDVLRGSQEFVTAATCEASAFGIFGVAMAAALIAGAPLWVLIGLGGAIPALNGTIASFAVRRSPVRVRYRHSVWSGGEMGSFLKASGLLFVTSLADLFIYSLDRLILGLFRPAATVALYEGPVRAHNVIRQVIGVLAFTVLPAGSSYLASGDEQRARDLIVRGTRYTLFVVLPLVVVFMTLAKPMLTVWLGPKYAGAATAMTILVGYWLLTANTNVPGTMLIAAGKVRLLAMYAWAIAIANLALSLALTPWLGLNGVVLGTSIPAVLSFPWFLWLVRRVLPVRIRDLAREAWAPSYTVAAVMAVVLVVIRVTLHPDTLGPVLGLAAFGVLGSWLAIYLFCLKPSERKLVSDMVTVVRARLRGMVPARGSAA